jgi:hypothetical protein
MRRREASKTLDTESRSNAVPTENYVFLFLCCR